ncbi:hypothetical protein [Sinomicrobium sp.]
MKTLSENQQTNYSTAIYKSLSLLATVFFSVLIVSCSGSDGDGDGYGAPTLEAIAEIDAMYFKEGSTTTPTIDWNGQQGTFALTGTPVQGLSIDKNTGVLSWGKDLPIGEHIVEITATNSVGNSSRSTVINNPFQGSFKGFYQYSTASVGGGPTYEVNISFTPDGKTTGRIELSSGTRLPFDGIWELTDDELFVEIIVKAPEGETATLSLTSELNSSDDAVYIGPTTLYVGEGTPEEYAYGDIQLCMGDCDL